MSEQVGSVTRKKSSDFHGKIRFQSRLTIRWELKDKNFLKIDMICLDDSVKYRIIAELLARAKRARSGAPWVRKFGKLSIRENLVMT